MYDFLSFEMLDLKIGIMQYLFEDIPDRGVVKGWYLNPPLQGWIQDFFVGGGNSFINN